MVHGAAEHVRVSLEEPEDASHEVDEARLPLPVERFVLPWGAAAFRRRRRLEEDLDGPGQQLGRRGVDRPQGACLAADADVVHERDEVDAVLHVPR